MRYNVISIQEEYTRGVYKRSIQEECYTYEIRWSGVICIQTGLAGALLLSCGAPPQSSTSLGSCTPLYLSLIYPQKLDCLVQLVKSFKQYFCASGICHHNIYLANSMTTIHTPPTGSIKYVWNKCALAPLCIIYSTQW